MANPVIIDLPADEWTKVATDVTGGFAVRLSTKPNKYLETYRDPGDPKPTEQSEGSPIFIDKDKEEIESPTGIDPYIMPVGADG